MPVSPVRSRKPLILASLLLASFAINLDVTIVNVALPTLVRDLHASNSQLQWIVDAYSLVFAALLLAAGSLGDRLGRKGILLAGLVVFGLASFAGGLTASSGQLIAARSVMGVGAAMIFPATLSLISNVFVERGERARAIGLWGATAGAAIALGPIVGGWLLEQFGWQSIFFAMAPVAAAGAALVGAFVPTSRDPDAGAGDYPGVVLSAAAMAVLIYTIIEAPTYGWASVRIISGFMVAGALFVAFVAREGTAAEPMLELSLFRDLRFSAASGSVTIAFFSLSGFIFLVTQYFQFFKHYGPLSFGLHLLPVATSVGIASVAGTKLAVRIGTKQVVAAGLIFNAVFFAWVSTVTAATSYATIALQMVIFGTGIGLTSAPATEAIMDVVPAAKAGVGSAVNDATRLLGSTLGVAIIGSVYASLYDTRLQTALPDRLPGRLADGAHDSVGAALQIAGQASADGQTGLGNAIHVAATSAFFHGFGTACLVAAGVSAAGAALAAAVLPAHPTRTDAEASAAPAVGQPIPAVE